MPKVVELPEDGTELAEDAESGGGVFFEEFEFRGKEVRIKQDTVAGV